MKRISATVAVIAGVFALGVLPAAAQAGTAGSAVTAPARADGAAQTVVQLSGSALGPIWHTDDTAWGH
ncbi:hypothetical protein [Kitasatospora sp. MAP5-34]|uniref:hypothetical protein n=1 Tax=Kitasatospora sp. MAP5-34 TaxID=3035102 RepID=UPI002475730C|nr:hypothetical protein [Kitasatospora sp. MAP5-34]MDH6578742.1 hypothetical protein [Kitasatospora sp. MAP5-34]